MGEWTVDVAIRGVDRENAVATLTALAAGARAQHIGIEAAWATAMKLSGESQGRAPIGIRSQWVRDAYDGVLSGLPSESVYRGPLEQVRDHVLTLVADGEPADALPRLHLIPAADDAP